MKMPEKCPSCGGRLLVTHLECAECGSRVDGKFVPCPVCTLGEEHRELFDLFMSARGNLKEVQRVLGVSYPTVRNRIEGMFAAYEARSTESSISRMDVLKLLKEGKISAADATELLKEASS